MTPMVSDLRKLRQIVVISELGSFTAASRVLALTQSALTKSVADVEATLDTKLFTRMARGVRPTEAGEQFVVGAKRILADTEELMERVLGYRELRSGRLRIGVAPFAYHPIVDRIIGSFATAHPALAIEICGGSVEEIFSRVSGGSLDVALGNTQVVERWPELQSQSLVRLDARFIGRKRHPAARGRAITEVELLQYPIVAPSDPLTNATLAGLLVRNGLPVRTARYQCDDFATVKAIVQGTDAVAPIGSIGPPGRNVRREFHVFDELADVLRMDLGVAHARSRPLSPAAEALRRHLTESARFADG